MSALEQAVEFHERSGAMDRQAKVDAAVALAEWGVFSGTQIAAIVGLPRKFAIALAGKKDRTGGKLTVESLRPLLMLSQIRARGESDIFAVKAALDAGASRRMASKLTGLPESTIRNHAARAEAAMANAEKEEK